MAPKQYTLDQLVVARQLRLVYERLPVSVLLTVVISLIFIGLIVPFFDHRKLLEWVLLTHFVCGARYLLWRSYARAHPTPAQSRLWSVLFVIGTVAAGTSWAFGPLTMMPAAGRVEMALLVVTLLSVSSVAVATLGAHFKAMLGFIGSALPLTIFAVVRNGGPVEIVLGAALGAAFIALVAVGRQSNVTTTQLLKTELELSDAVAETAAARATAEASSRAKSQFLANMSHEVRTPLNGILGNSEILGAGELDSRQRRQVELLRASAAHLLRIVNDILDLSKIEAGRLELDSAPFDLRKVAEDVVELLAAHASGKGLELTCDMPTSLHASFRGDGLRLRQVLFNLLGNAIKFTDRGSVGIRVHELSCTNVHSELRIEVHDTGIGIRPENQAMIFESFAQEDGSTTRRHGGTGLGLSISRQLVALMGGTLDLSSTPGAGSTFYFTLRLARDDSAGIAGDTANDREILAGSAAEALSVLLVEDNPVNLEVALAMLESLAVTVTAARNGREALAELRKRAFDVVLMDCQMPLMDGYQATREFRAFESRDPQRRRTRIIALTANALQGDEQKCHDAGMDAYLSKPFTLAQLTDTLSAARLGI